MARKFKGVITILSALSIFVVLQYTSFAQAENANGFDHLYSIYDSLLKQYVHNGRVNYKGFIASSEKFDTYLEQLGSVSEKDYANWSREEELAFWINAYNALTIKAIIDHYPIERNKNISVVSFFYPKDSIRQIDGVWDKLRFRAVGKMVTLEEIEHGTLRKEFKEPRIHFAIVCASLGCPDLKSEAYRADKINEQLESAAMEFINNPEKGAKISPADRTVKISKIFNWFGGDFIDKYGDTELFKGRDTKERAVLNFISQHLRSKGERAFLESNQFKISYLNYDWSLNELKS